MKRVAVLGAGAMGTAVAVHLRRNGSYVNLWGTERDEEVVRVLQEVRRCPRLDVALPPGIEVFPADELGRSLDGVEGVIIAVVSDAVEPVVRRMLPWLHDSTIIINLAKGIHPTGLTMLQLIRRILIEEYGLMKLALVMMGGPARAIEIVRGMYTEIVLSSSDKEAAQQCLKAFRGPTLRARFVRDVIGVELCAALKNGFAIAIGICEGLQPASDNMKAALFSEASLELGKIVTAAGGNPETVLGPAGVGDLYVTAQGGRNRSLGKMLGEGGAVESAVERMQATGQTIEGYGAVQDGYSLARLLEKEGKLEIDRDLPLLNGLYVILFEGKPVDEVIRGYWVAASSE